MWTEICHTITLYVMLILLYLDITAGGVSIVPAQYICLLHFIRFCIDCNKFTYFSGGCGMEVGISNNVTFVSLVLDLIKIICTRHLIPEVS